MLITNPIYLAKLKTLQQNYANLPWYKRLLFSLCAYRLSHALSAIDANHPTKEQIQTLLSASKKSWFFKSIFGVLTQFNQAVSGVSFARNASLQTLPEELLAHVGKHLLTNEARALALASKTIHSACQPGLRNQKLLYLMTRKDRNYDLIKATIERDSSSLSRQGGIIGHSGYHFSKISPFEYAMWTMERGLPERLLGYIPNNPEGKVIRAQLNEQYARVRAISSATCTYRTTAFHP
jgi:hypothetical protein